MTDKKYHGIKRIVRPVLQYKRDALVECEATLSDEDRFIWAALPKFGNAIGRSQWRIKEEVARRPLGKVLAPVIEATISQQALAFNLLVGARSRVLRTGARAAGKCATALDKALERVKE